MIFCPNCRTGNPDNSVFCSTCRARLDMIKAPAPMQPPRYDQPPVQPQYREQDGFVPIQYYDPKFTPPRIPPYQQQVNAYGNGAPMPPRVSLGWHKFTVNFFLFAIMVICFFRGIMYITGYDIYSEPEFTYNTFSGIRVIDIIYGVLTVGMLFFAIVVRSKLAGFMHDGPGFLLSFFILNIVLSVFYDICVAIMFANKGTSSEQIISMLLNPSVISEPILFGVFTLVNSIYYKNRKSLFKN